MGEETVKGSRYQSPGFSAGPWAQVCHSSMSSTHGEYIAIVQQECHSLEPYEGEELRAEIRRVLKHSYTPKMNIMKEERKVLKELRRDRTSVILTTDKGCSSSSFG